MSYESARALLSKSVSRPTLYSVKIPGLKRGVSDYLQLFTEQVTIPAITHDVALVLGQEHHGVERTQPYAVKFGKPLTIQVIENSNFQMYKAFRELFNLSAEGSNPYNQGSGQISPNDSIPSQLEGFQGGRLYSRKRTQRMKYYSDFTFDLTLTKLENPDKDSKQITDDPINQGYKEVQNFIFTNAYVTSVSEISLGSNMYDTYTQFRVGFGYETYYTEGVKGLNV